MSGAIAKMCRVMAASLGLFAILMLSTSAAFAHVGFHARQPAPAPIILKLAGETYLAATPSDQAPSQACLGGAKCCMSGPCSIQQARLVGGASFAFAPLIQSHRYAATGRFGLAGIAASPSTPPPRTRV